MDISVAWGDNRLFKVLTHESQQKSSTINSESRLLLDVKVVLDKYCNELYNSQLTSDPSILQDTQETNSDPEDMQIAIDQRLRTQSSHRCCEPLESLLATIKRQKL